MMRVFRGIALLVCRTLHSQSQRIHTRVIAVLLVVALARSGGFSVGCHNGPSEGEIGGACHQPEGCHENEWCDDGACEDSRCQVYTPPPPPPGPCSDRAPNAACASDELAEVCPTGANPADFCAPTNTTVDGGLLYCCAPCWPTDVNYCKRPDAGWDCNRPHSPAERSPNLSCVEAIRLDDVALAAYCCATEPTCFSVYDNTCKDAYVCAGDASPPHENCSPTDGGANRVCCEDPDAGDSD